MTSHDPFPSTRVPARRVDVWVPPGYDQDEATRYPVVYLHDGQNLFDDALSFSGVAWGIDKAVEKLTGEGQIRTPLLVGIWNTEGRIQEYMPQKPLDTAPATYRDHFAKTFGGPPCSDAYLAFLVTELKPFVDATYRTLPERADTFIMGSSMGGLASLYAFCEYPEVFGGAACLSTSWTIGGHVLLAYLERCLPTPDGRAIYFDYGSEAQIAAYERHQRRVDGLMRGAGYQRARAWSTHRYPGAPHSEQAWKERVDVPLRFLLNSHETPGSHVPPLADADQRT